MISNIQPLVANSTPVNVEAKTISGTAVKTSGYNVSVTGADTASVSTLSRQLGESAVRAEAREKYLSRQGLSELVHKLKNQFQGESYTQNKALHALEAPSTQDPKLLERAQQATVYVTKSELKDPTAKNPFAGLTREQLTLIAFDDSGAYTVNERGSASRGIDQMEEQWRGAVMARAELEPTVGGRRTQFLTECLAHYRALPAIDQAQYDEGYEGRLIANIKNDSVDAKKTDDRLMTLFEILAGIVQPEKKEEKHKPKSLPIAGNFVGKAEAKAQGPVANETSRFMESSSPTNSVAKSAGAARSE